jgi:outer membrane protein TolC
MGGRIHIPVFAVVAAAHLTGAVYLVQAEGIPLLIAPEQRTAEVRDPQQIPGPAPPVTPPPRTVTQPGNDLPALYLSLDEAIRVALANADVIRILAGTGAVSSGRTVYDVAIATTAIDEQQARFDPTIDWGHNFDRTESPVSILDPADPNGSRIGGIRTDGYRMNLGTAKTAPTGGVLSFGVNSNPERFQPGIFALTPQDRYSLDLGLTQPLWRGAGVPVNRAPIVIARIDTERSFFQYKDSVQEMVRSVIEAYWNLVFARTDLWTRQQQVVQSKEAYDRAEARFRNQLASQAEVAQTRVSWGNFRATLIAAEANVLQREAALRNVLGLPPTGEDRLVPVSPPADRRVDFDWEDLLALSETNRPDLIELKLVLEADRQQLDASMLYRWNGLEGRTPTGAQITTQGGEYTDWTMGVNFSVPLTLRRGRASMRRQELIVARDRANLRQGVHGMTHELATTLRGIDQSYEQYELFREVRVAAARNLAEQWSRYQNELTIYLNVLLAITDWGNAVSSEAQSLSLYNTQLANLESQSGTVLETHGVRFFEERFGSIGPMGRLAPDQPYLERLPPTDNEGRYETGNDPSENFFDLRAPFLRRSGQAPGSEEVPPPRPGAGGSGASLP